MESKIADIAKRVKEMRELCEFTEKDMASFLDISIDEYKEYESGKKDFGFTILYKCAEKFGIDIIELLTGGNPHLSAYTVVRKGQGLPMKRRSSFEYYHLAYNFKNKISEPFVVFAPYDKDKLNSEIETSTHEGQEFDLVLEGSLKFTHDGHIVELNEGDSVYYDSGKPHGMIATSKNGCKFLAIVMKGGQN